MNADEFANRLQANEPTADELIEHGWPQSLVEEVKARYICPLRNQNLDIDGKDALLDFINRYSVETVEIGFIRFDEPPKQIEIEKYGTCLIVASVDADFLACSLNSGEILLLDGCNLPFVMTRVARDGESFLDSLIELVEATRRADDPVQVAQRCAELAGSEEAIGFYEMLAG